MVFWRWWTITILLYAAAIVAQLKYSVFAYIYNNDPTFISFLIMLIAVCSNFCIGYFTYKIKHKVKIQDNDLQVLRYFTSSTMGLGTLGTLIGFLMVLSIAFSNIDTSSTEAMKLLIGTLGQGMGVAIITSITGLVSALILNLQLVLMDTANEKI